MILLRNLDMSLVLIFCVFKADSDHIRSCIVIEAFLLLFLSVSAIELLDLVLLPLIPLETNATPDYAAQEGQ